MEAGALGLSDAVAVELTESIMKKVGADIKATEEKLKADIGEVIELNMEAEEELRSGMADIIREAKDAVAEAGNVSNSSGGGGQGGESLGDIM